MERPPLRDIGVRLRTLGSLRIIDANGQSLASLEAQPKRAALLIYLACLPPGHLCPRDELLGLFWPDFGEERARNSLRASLYYIRRSVGGGIVRTRSDGALEVSSEGLWCDVRAFEAAVREGRDEEAASLYEGDFLAGSSISLSAEFDQWLESTRERLRRQCADALLRVADACELARDADGEMQALAHARKLAPADEATLRRMLLLLGRRGNRALAAQEYERFARMLADVYELEPSPETRDILTQVTDGDGRGPSQARSSVPRDAVQGPRIEPYVKRLATFRGHTPQPVPRRPPGHPWRPTLTLAAATVMIAALSLLATRAARGKGAAIAGSGSAVMAVLPFDVGGHDELRPIADVLPSLLSHHLRRLGLEVVAPSSMRAPGLEWDDYVARARKYGVKHLVTGAVIAEGDRIIVLVSVVPTEGAPRPTLEARVTGVLSAMDSLAGELAAQVASGSR